MKTRTDFVSNSSSCSFVINDVKKAVSCIKSLGDGGIIPYDLDSLDIRISATRKVLKDLCEKLEKSSYYADYFSDNLEVDDCCDFTLGELESIPDDFIDKIGSVRFTCDDFEHTQVMYLSLLYLFLKNEGVDVNDDDSEQPLMFQDNDSTFLGNLFRRVFNKRG